MLLGVTVSLHLGAINEIFVSVLPAQLPEELVTCGSRVHERVGYYCGCVAHRISDCILKLRGKK